MAEAAANKLMGYIYNSQQILNLESRKKFNTFPMFELTNSTFDGSTLYSFEYTCKVGHFITMGTGKNKKIAKNVAAINMLLCINGI